MKPKTKILFSCSILLLILMYFFPIWSISLEAPQYPEGLGLYINISSMTGHKTNDLNSINNLNHYIGMKVIKPESINELKIMPYIIGFMMLFGVLILLINKKKLILVWIIIFTIISVIGLYDFYLWGYDYGHNLDPKAIIKIPGMFYQPPVFGTKQLLNFTAHSYPSIGGIAAFLSIIIAFISLDVFKKKKGKN
jgi:copper chaperone NosL